jgi:hypothetical protein
LFSPRIYKPFCWLSFLRMEKSPGYIRSMGNALYWVMKNKDLPRLSIQNEHHEVYFRIRYVFVKFVLFHLKWRWMISRKKTLLKSCSPLSVFVFEARCYVELKTKLRKIPFLSSTGSPAWSCDYVFTIKDRYKTGPCKIFFFYQVSKTKQKKHWRFPGSCSRTVKSVDHF